MFRVRNLLVLVLLITSLAQAELVELIKINSTFKLDVRYATTNNFTHKQVYPSARCFLQKPAAYALDEVQRDLATQGLGLIIFDAYRPLRVQKIFWEICPDPRYVADPAYGSRHNRGCAIDASLVDLKTGKELEMPSEFDDFSERASRNESVMSPEVLKNYRMLNDAMVKHGFVGVSSEWWHFDYDPEHKDSWKQYPVLDVDIEHIGIS